MEKPDVINSFKMKKLLGIVVLGLIFINLLLLITNKSFLISEVLITEIEFEGGVVSKLNSNQQYYSCNYWTGRSIITAEFYASAVKQCPFIYDL